MASRLFATDRRYAWHHDVVDLFAEVPISTSGAVGTLTSTKTMGVKTVVQAAAAAAAAGGSVYVVSLNDAYARLLDVGFTSSGQAGAVSAIAVAADNVGGSVGAITCASVAAADTVTVLVPGSAAVTYTAVAYGATPGDNEFCVGNATGADAESANNLAAVIRNDSDDSDQAGKGDTNGNGGSTTTPSSLTAWAFGSTVVLRCSVPGAQVKTSNATKLRAMTNAVGTANTYATMYPGVVLRTAVGVTATVPAASDKYLLRLTLQNSSM